MEVILTSRQLIYVILYLVAVGATVLVEHRLVAELWRKHEIARRIMGIVTVMGLAMPLLLLGVLDWVTWLTLMGGFCVAGSIIGTVYIWKHAKQEEEKLDAIREEATFVMYGKDED